MNNDFFKVEPKQEIKYINSKPDDNYVIRILEAYLEECAYRMSTKSTTN